jgi:5-methylcytosine-specific restriction protein B
MHFEILRDRQGQRGNRNDNDYQQLRNAYQAIQNWANGLREKRFQNGRVELLMRPTNQAGNYYGYLWARIYPTNDSPEWLAYTLAIDNLGFVVKIDTYGDVCQQLRKRYEIIRGDDLHNSPIVRILPLEDDKEDWETTDLVEWACTAIDEITSYSEVLESLKKNNDPSEFSDEIPDPKLDEKQLKEKLKEYLQNDNDGIRKIFFENLITNGANNNRVLSREINEPNNEFLRQLINYDYWGVPEPEAQKTNYRLREDNYKNLINQVISNNTNTEFNKIEKKSMPLNQILYGPPGTGKTYLTAERAVLICTKGEYPGQRQTHMSEDEREELMDTYNKLVQDKQIKFVTFHQSYGYEEFIEGIRPVLHQSIDVTESPDKTVGYKIEDGVFRKISKEAEKNPDKNYVIIVDEINRGNISKIFGELITLIEEDKREGRQNAISVILPYSKKEFSVPSNVYIIGTMNTADRSLANVDTALRRRFHFEPMMPDPTALSGLNINDIDIQKLLEVINQRIEALYDREHTIGHAYFTELLDNTINEDAKFKKLKSIFENKVIPLLEEYFFDDWQKIHLVLGDNKKPADYQFIKEIETNYSELFGNNDLTDSYSTKSYQINKISFDKPQSYIGIYTVQNNEQ